MPTTEIRRPLIDMQKASLEARPGDIENMKPLKEGGVFRPGRWWNDNMRRR